MFKRAGRGHEEGGIAATPLGGVALRCPACPDFERNLPEDWKSRPFQYVTLNVPARSTYAFTRWMYRVILSLDANFRLSNRLTRSTATTDPNLTAGRAYLVPEADYAQHIADTEGDDPDPVRFPCLDHGQS